MSAHTKGPWVAEDRGDPGLEWVEVVGANERSIADVGNSAANDWSEEDEANARLIAAAPDLLGACEALKAGVEDAVLRFLDSNGLQLRSDMEAILRARLARAEAAIAKARVK